MHDGVVVLDRYVPFADVLCATDARFVVYPSSRKAGEYQVQGVPCSSNSKVVKQPFPVAWCCCEEADLPRTSGYAGLRFCHKNGFLISCADQRTALPIAYDL